MTSEIECKHPPNRYYSWVADVPKLIDNKVIVGHVVCVACCDCGVVLSGVVENNNGETNSF